MHKISILWMAFLLMGGVVQAQTLQDTWNVFDVSSKTTTEVKVEVSLEKEPEGPVIASVVADDDREDITGQASGFEKAVVVLEMDYGGQRGLCSGSMVGPNTVLTAAHCLNHAGEYMNAVQVYAVGLPPSKDNKTQPEPQEPQNPTDPRDSIRLLPPKDDSKVPNLPEDINAIIRRLRPELPKSKLKLPKRINTNLDRLVNTQVVTQTDTEKTPGLKDFLEDLRSTGYPSAAAQKMWVPSEWIDYTRDKYGSSVDLEKEEKYDYGIIVLDSALGAKTGYLELGVPSTAQLRNANILVVGRGGDKPARSLWRACGRVGEVFPSYFLHNADQVGGNSGGPIFNTYNTSKIIALANFGNGAHHVEGGYPNGGLRITQSIVKAVRFLAK